MDFRALMSTDWVYAGGTVVVSSQTVYAIFRSKRGIHAEILERVAFGPHYQELVQRAREAPNPVARLRLAARIARQIFDSERAELRLLQGAGMVAPELSAIQQEREATRFEAQAPTIAYLAARGCLRANLTPQKRGKSCGR